MERSVGLYSIDEQRDKAAPDLSCIAGMDQRENLGGGKISDCVRHIEVEPFESTIVPVGQGSFKPGL